MLALGIGCGVVPAAAQAQSSGASADRQAAQTTIVLGLDDRLQHERRMGGDMWRYGDQRGARGALTIQPATERAQALWNGSGAIRTLPPLTGASLPAPVLRINLMMRPGAGGRTAALRAVQLRAAESWPHLQPMLGQRPVLGCDAFSAALQLENAGWGAVKDARLTLRFWSRDAESADVVLDVPGFDQTQTVDLTPALAALGVDVGQLRAAGPMPCPEGRTPADCAHAFATANGAAALADVALGSTVAYRDGAPTILYHLRASGTLAYGWTDAQGEAQRSEQPLAVTVSLGLSSAPEGTAPPARPDLSAALSSLAPARPSTRPPAASRHPTEAPDLQPGRLRAKGQAYGVPLILRGNPNRQSVSLLAALEAPQSSVHRLSVVAGFDDGSAQRSTNVTLHLLRPRPLPQLAEDRAGCTLLPPLSVPDTLLDPLLHPDHAALVLRENP